MLSLNQANLQQATGGRQRASRSMKSKNLLMTLILFGVAYACRGVGLNLMRALEIAEQGSQGRELAPCRTARDLLMEKMGREALHHEFVHRCGPRQ